MENTALITWASSWIGRELAIIHAERWGNLIIVSRSKDKLISLQEELEKKYHIKVVVIVKDLTGSNSCKELYDEIKNLWIDIEYLINNAWFGWQWFFYGRDWEDDKNMIQLNIIALTELTRYFLDDMVARKKGRILNVGSTASFMPGPLQAVYYATKSYVRSFSNALSRELKDTWITVTNLMPWATETQFKHNAWLDKTKLFKKTVPARWVAEDGYNAMLKWKMDVISWLGFIQSILVNIISMIPKKVLLNVVFDMQKK